MEVVDRGDGGDLRLVLGAEPAARLEHVVEHLLEAGCGVADDLLGVLEAFRVVPELADRGIDLLSGVRLVRQRAAS